MEPTTIPCGWCDTPVVVTEDHGQVVYCSDDHARADEYNDGKTLIAGVLYDDETLEEANPQ